MTGLNALERWEGGSRGLILKYFSTFVRRNRGELRNKSLKATGLSAQIVRSAPKYRRRRSSFSQFSWTTSEEGYQFVVSVCKDRVSNKVTGFAKTLSYSDMALD
jgi:hypothetical protein